MADEVLKGLTPLGELECGCLIFGGETIRAYIDFCPVHAAAHTLLSSLLAIEDDYIAQLVTGLFWCEWCNAEGRKPIDHDADCPFAALAAARPEEVQDG